MSESTIIVAAVDRFPQDDAVLARAVELATAFGSKLTIAHFVGQIDGWNLADAEQEMIERQALLVARERIETALLRYADAGISIDIRIDSGSPAMRLIELSEEIVIDLFVMGANQSDSLIDKVLGSTTDRIIRATGVTVLVVKRQVKSAYRHVLIAVDTPYECSGSFDAVADWFAQAEFELVHIVQVPVQFEEAMLRAGSSQARIMGYSDALVLKAQSCLHTITEQLNNRVARFTPRVMTGDPTTTLVSLSRNIDTELIALEPRSSSRIRQALLGSVTRQLLRAAMCDVLIFRGSGNRMDEKSRL